MILKYFELNKLSFSNTNFILLHGKNDGYKNEEIKKIAKNLKKKITSYDEKNWRSPRLRACKMERY